MSRSTRKMTGLLAIGAIGLFIGLAACTQPGASPSPTAMMEETASPAMMEETSSPDAMMETSSPDAMMETASPDAMMESATP